MEEDEFFENEMAMDSVEANAIEDMDEDNYYDPLSGTVVGLVQDHYPKAFTFHLYTYEAADDSLRVNSDGSILIEQQTRREAC